jgi:hypothetical protein
MIHFHVSVLSLFHGSLLHPINEPACYVQSVLVLVENTYERLRFSLASIAKIRPSDSLLEQPQHRQFLLPTASSLGTVVNHKDQTSRRCIAADAMARDRD